MAFKTKEIVGGGGKDFAPQKNIDPGVYPARVVQLIDLGLQPQRPYQGQDRPPAQEIMISYELVDEFMKDDDGNDIEDKPRWISETMPLRAFTNERAKSTQRVKAFDPQDVHDGDISQCIGTPVNVTVINNPGQGDKVYDNVANVAAMRPRDAAACPELKNPTKVFDSTEPDMEVFNALPKWIQDKIKGNLNYAGSALEKALAGKPEAKKEEKPKKDRAAKVDKEDAPFDADNAADDNPY